MTREYPVSIGRNNPEYECQVKMATMSPFTSDIRREGSRRCRLKPTAGISFGHCPFPRRSRRLAQAHPGTGRPQYLRHRISRGFSFQVRAPRPRRRRCLYSY